MKTQVNSLNTKISFFYIFQVCQCIPLINAMENYKKLSMGLRQGKDGWMNGWMDERASGHF